MLDTHAAPSQRSKGFALAVALHAAVFAIALRPPKKPVEIIEVSGKDPVLTFVQRKPEGRHGGAPTAPKPKPASTPRPRSLTQPKTVIHDTPPPPAAEPAGGDTPDEPAGDVEPGSGGPVAGAPGPGIGDPQGGGDVIDLGSPPPQNFTRPRTLCDPPRMPEPARLMGVTGAVVVRYVIDADGSASDVQLLTPGAPPVLVEAVRSWLSECRFDPARVDSRAVRIRVTQPFLFKIQ